MNYNDAIQNKCNSQSSSQAATSEHKVSINESREDRETKPLQTPKARLFQTQEAWILQLALPNIKSENINIEERGQDLYIHAENDQKRFERSFKLPPNERFTEIQAELSKGILSVKIRSTAPTIRKIKVHSA